MINNSHNYIPGTPWVTSPWTRQKFDTVCKWPRVLEVHPRPGLGPVFSTNWVFTPWSTKKPSILSDQTRGRCCSVLVVFGTVQVPWRDIHLDRDVSILNPSSLKFFPVPFLYFRSPKFLYYELIKRGLQKKSIYRQDLWMSVGVIIVVYVG